MKTIRLEIIKRVAYINMQKPKANSYDLDYMTKIADLIAEANENEEVKVIVLQSSIEKFFCAGADIKTFEKNTVEQNKLLVRQANTVAKSLAESPKITVALLNGHTLGGGLELAMACDIRLASDGNFLIGLSEVKLGLMPGNGGTQRLIRLINPRLALELLVTGRSIHAKEAYRIGLVNQLYAVEEFEKESKSYVESLAQGPFWAMKAIKESVYKGLELSLEQGLALEATLADKLYETADAKEGLKSFTEKRKPNFR